MCKVNLLAVAVLMAIPWPANGQNASAFDLQQLDPVSRRKLRERAVTRVGPVARDLVEAFGEHAVVAIFKCSKAMGIKLAEFYADGRLTKLPEAKWFLKAVADHGDPVVQFGFDHHQELTDAVRCAAFVSDPMTYVASLKSLDTGAAEYKQRREYARQAKEPDEKDAWIGAGILGGLIGIAVFLHKRHQALNSGM